MPVTLKTGSLDGEWQEIRSTATLEPESESELSSLSEHLQYQHPDIASVEYEKLPTFREVESLEELEVRR